MHELAALSTAFSRVADESSIDTGVTSDTSTVRFGTQYWVLPHFGPTTHWVVSSGVLYIRTVALLLAHTSPDACSCLSPSVALVGTNDWQDYEFTVRLKLNTTMQTFGLLVRAAVTGLVVPTSIPSHVRLSLNTSANCLSLIYDSGGVGGVLTTLAAVNVTNTTFPPNVWHVFTVAVSGDYVAALVNGVVMLEAPLPSGVALTGRAGLFNCGGNYFAVSDASVRFLVNGTDVGDVTARPYLPDGGVTDVTVTISGLPAQCTQTGTTFQLPQPRAEDADAGPTPVVVDGCLYQFSALETPQVVAALLLPTPTPTPRIDASEVEPAPTVIEVTALGLPSLSTSVTVRVGAQECVIDVATYSPSQFNCTTSALPVGTYFLSLSLAVAGWSQSPLLSSMLRVPTRQGVVGTLPAVYSNVSRTHLLLVNNVSASAVGPAGGGSRLRLFATGGAVKPSDNVVSVCGTPCSVDDNDTQLYRLSCVTTSGYPQLSVGSGEGETRQRTFVASESVAVWDTTVSYSAASVTLQVPQVGGVSQLALRFPGLAIPIGSEILTATLRLTSAQDLQATDVTTTISAVTTVPDPSLAYLVAKRPSPAGVGYISAPTVGSVTWLVPPWLAQGEPYESPDVSVMLQTVSVCVRRSAMPTDSNCLYTRLHVTMRGLW